MAHIRQDCFNELLKREENLKSVVMLKENEIKGGTIVEIWSNEGADRSSILVKACHDQGSQSIWIDMSQRLPHQVPSMIIRTKSAQETCIALHYLECGEVEGPTAKLVILDAATEHYWSSRFFKGNGVDWFDRMVDMIASLASRYAMIFILSCDFLYTTHSDQLAGNKYQCPRGANWPIFKWPALSDVKRFYLEGVNENVARLFEIKNKIDGC
ncbi:hypothetical protein ACOME3_000397 [Neoechinorhynchus agilis]